MFQVQLLSGCSRISSKKDRGRVGSVHIYLQARCTASMDFFMTNGGFYRVDNREIGIRPARRLPHEARHKALFITTAVSEV